MQVHFHLKISIFFQVKCMFILHIQFYVPKVIFQHNFINSFFFFRISAKSLGKLLLKWDFFNDDVIIILIFIFILCFQSTTILDKWRGFKVMEG